MQDVVEELGLIMFACIGAGLGAVRNFQKQRSTRLNRAERYMFFIGAGQRIAAG